MSDAVQRLQKITFLGILSPGFRNQTNCPLYQRRKKIIDDGTRLDHSIAVSALAVKLAIHLDLPKETRRYAAAWGLIHDLSTWPLSHTGEAAFSTVTGVGSRQLRRMMVLGDRKLSERVTVTRSLRQSEIETDKLLSLFDKKVSPSDAGLRILWQIVHSPLTPDSLEGIWRCASSFGVKVKHPEAWVRIFNADLFSPLVRRRGSRDARQFWRKKSRIYDSYINNPDVIAFESCWSESIKNIYHGISLSESLDLEESDIISNVIEKGISRTSAIMRYKAPLSYNISSQGSPPKEQRLEELEKVLTKQAK